jgi:hypothetical protein
MCNSADAKLRKMCIFITIVRRLQNCTNIVFCMVHSVIRMVKVVNISESFLQEMLRYCIVQCWGYLTTSDYQLYRVTPLKTPFGVLIPLLQSSPTRNYIHSQLFLTLLCVYTIIILTRSWLQSLITLLHWLTSQLSITVSNYHTLYIFTLWNSRRDFTPWIHFLRLTP